MMPHVNMAEGASLIRMDIQTVVFGGMQMPSLIVLKAADDTRDIHLPIRIGPIEAAAITAGIEHRDMPRPLTHDLLSDTISSLGAQLVSVSVVGVHGTTFYATLQLMAQNGHHIDVDCRPSDAIALAVRCMVPIYAREQVLETATMPDFQKVEEAAKQSDLDAFHDFVEGLSPEDFA